MRISTGDPNITIGLIDGPVDLDHSAFAGSKIRTVKDSQVSVCKNASSIACSHGTFIAGMLCARRGVSAPAICPDCQVVLYPIFREEFTNNSGNDDPFPSVSTQELANAIIETVNAGAKIINLSLGTFASSFTLYQTLQEAYDYALRKHVIVVIAAGNQGNMGNISLINHQWPIPVASCDENGRLVSISNFGPSIKNRGLMAPGVSIKSTQPGGQYAHMNGTSFAAPFVTGCIALLWSIFPNASPSDIIHSLLRGTRVCQRSVIPSLLNAEVAYNILKK
jgi:subtilisin family serine protease